MSQSTTKCPSCGQTATGKFCSGCGATLGAAACSSCGSAMTPGARFCHACGSPTETRPKKRGTTSALPWAIAGAAVVVLVIVLAVRLPVSGQPPQQTGTAPIGLTNRPPPDISSMTPRQQADRLFDRILTAVERGDSAEVNFFTPMGLQAYANLGKLDNDAHYDVGLINAVTGNETSALAHADSIETDVPGHLLAITLRHSVAEMRGDSAAVLSAYRRFLKSYEREIAAQRPEYQTHRSTIDSFYERARSSTGGDA